jgi:NTE family protein
VTSLAVASALTRPELKIVYGGGGPFATAYGMGVAAALADHGVALDTTPVLGTSGGSWAAAGVAAGLGYDTLKAITRQAKLPDLRPGRLHGLATELFADRGADNVWASAIRLSNGKRTLLWAGEHSLADLVSASSAVPWLLAPHRVDGSLYLDGGTRSWINADRAQDADELLVIAPGIAPALGPFGAMLGRQLTFEVRRWRRRTGGRVRVFRPAAEFGRQVTRWSHLFDYGLAAEVYDHGQRQALRALAPGGRLEDLPGRPSGSCASA